MLTWLPLRKTSFKKQTRAETSMSVHLRISWETDSRTSFSKPTQQQWQPPPLLGWGSEPRVKMRVTQMYIAVKSHQIIMLYYMKILSQWGYVLKLDLFTPKICSLKATSYFGWISFHPFVLYVHNHKYIKYTFYQNGNYINNSATCFFHLITSLTSFSRKHTGISPFFFNSYSTPEFGCTVYLSKTDLMTTAFKKLPVWKWCWTCGVKA